MAAFRWLLFAGSPGSDRLAQAAPARLETAAIVGVPTMNQRKMATGFLFTALVLLELALAVCAVYVIVHFIAKFW
jgi:hypothetical protein